MAPVATKTNFKSYEAQARLLRAVVAAHPEVKWNYKDIRTLYGSDMTKDMLDHRFKAIRAHADVIRDAVVQGVDCANIPVDLPKGRKDIAKFFGESTADGIQFQFRGIKKDAEAMKKTAHSGGNPATVLNLSGAGPSSAVSTPRRATPSKPRASGGGRSTATKINPNKFQSMSDDDDYDEEDIVDYNALEDTPSKSRRDRVIGGRITKASTPSRRSNTHSRVATIVAAANISHAAAVDLNTSDSEVNTPENTTAYEPVDTNPTVARQSCEQHFAQPMIQTAAVTYMAPSSLSQQSSSEFNTVLEDSLASFVDSCSGSFNQSFKTGYMDDDGIGEI